MTLRRPLSRIAPPLAGFVLAALAASSIPAAAHATTLEPVHAATFGSTHADPETQTGSPVDARTSFASLYGVSGFDPYDAGARLMALEWPRAHTVVMTSGASLADAVSAGPLAARRDQPLVLVDTAAADGTLAFDLEVFEREDAQEHQVRHVTIVGGPAAVSATYEAYLHDRGITTDRVYGADRYATSLAVAQQPELREADGVVIATGRNRHLVDAVTAGGVAGALAMPVLLADPGREQALTAFMDARPRTAVAVGGKVDEDVVGAYAPQHLFGEDRYATMLAVARWAAERGVDTSTVSAVSGQDPSLALVAGALGRVTLLVPGDFDAKTREWIAEHGVQRAVRIAASPPTADATAG